MHGRTGRARASRSIFRSAVAGKGNPGVTALIKQTPGAIGYVEYGYAKQTEMPMAALENKSGKYVKADLATGKNALASVRLPANLRAWIPDPTGADAYPIVTYTWLLCYKKYEDPKIAATLKSVIQYGLTEGQTFSVRTRLHPAARQRRQRGQQGARTDFMIPSETGAARNIYHPGGHSGDEMEVPAAVEISQPPSAFEIATDRIFPPLHPGRRVVHGRSRVSGWSSASDGRRCRRCAPMV